MIDMPELFDSIVCPHCQTEFIPYGQLDGGAQMECLYCKKEFKVYIWFHTEPVTEH